ncbi:MAG TPA: hypothetical protein VFZ27_15720 [Terriglobia bacterium]|nr:hypothetical protein [Terriglobia bacterium]
MMHSGHEVACRIERGEAAGARAWAEGYQRLFPGDTAAWLEIAGGCAVFAGRDSPVTQVQGAAMRGPVSKDEFKAIEDFFFSRNSRAQVVVCPLAHPSLLEGLSKRGYTVAEMENVLAMPLDAQSVASAPASEVEVRPIERGEGREWAETVARGFIEQPEFMPAGSDLKLDETFIRLLMAGEESKGYFSFAASLGGRMIGGGTLFMHEGVAMLNGASTLAAFRRRGAHSALHFARLAYALSAGCTLARVVTQPGSTSQRNAERRGFRVVYTRAALVRKPTVSGRAAET